MRGRALVVAIVFAVVVAVIATACTPVHHPGGGHGQRGDGFVDARWWRDRQNGFLDYATESFAPGSITNVIAHAEAARRGIAKFDSAAVTPAGFASSFDRIDTFKDTADFDLLYLMNLWLGYRGQLTAELRAAIESRMVRFKYWYTDPQPAGFIDQRYYWSENHRLLYHVEEYLSGQTFPSTRFTITGWTGARHRARAAKFIDDWLVQKARFGFTEWHSDVYYQKTADALLTFVEFANDRALVERAAMVLDLLLFDIALNLQRGNLGSTHGRSYMKDKSVAEDQDVFGMSKLLFDDTKLPYNSIGDAGAVLFSRAHRYHLPAVLLRVARSRATTVDEEHMGVPLDPSAPVTPAPVAPYGYSFDDPANVPFWWERGALTAWQFVETTIKELDKYNLWESDFFKPFKPLVELTGGDFDVARSLAHQLNLILGFALLTEVDTYNYRSPSVMLSTAQSYRPGTASEQHHISQATLDEHAIVFTTHPKNEPIPGTQWPDEDGYWTGNGTLPRAAQHGALSLSLYTPKFASPGPPLDSFAYLDYTHAYFPRERFDEVVQQNGWTFGRKGDGYVALWSWRPVQWRTYSDPTIYTHGLTQPFDLVAPGGADDVWVTQVGDAARFGDFAHFRAAVVAHAVSVTPRPRVNNLPGGFDVSYVSPTEGAVTFGTEAPLTVRGAVTPINGYPRYDNPWSHTPFDAKVVRIADRFGGEALDFLHGRRFVHGRSHWRH